jgi:hypothetical protein
MKMKKNVKAKTPILATCFPLRSVKMGVVLVLFLLARLNAQGTPDSPPSLVTGYNNATLGFRYMPPVEMQDRTERSRAEIEPWAESLHSNNILRLLLSMASGADDTATDCHSLSIETYPRKSIEGPDASAETKMSGWVARSKQPRAAPRSAVISGQSFEVSIYGRDEGSTQKFLVVWTTTRKDKLLSFAFVANSPQQLKKLTESMKSVQFF